MSWMQVEEYLQRDDRAVLPIGSTEQHAYLSLATDNILAERVAVEGAEPLGVPVFPVVNYGITPYFRAYPGTVSLSIATFLAVLRDILDGLAAQRIPPRADRQRPRRQRAGAAARRRVDGVASGTPGQVSTTGGTRRARSPR